MWLLVWCGFLVESIYMGLVTVSIQPVCVVWLEHLIHLHLHLKQLCIYIYIYIYIYVPIAIFSTVWNWFCRSFFLLFFLDYISPFNICCKAGLVYWMLLTFPCLKSFIFLHQFWIRSFQDTIILVVIFPFNTLNISSIPFWPEDFLLKDQLLSVRSFPSIVLVASPLLLLRFFLSV